MSGASTQRDIQTGTQADLQTGLSAQPAPTPRKPASKASKASKASQAAGQPQKTGQIGGEISTGQPMELKEAATSAAPKAVMRRRNARSTVEPRLPALIHTDYGKRMSEHAWGACALVGSTLLIASGRLEGITNSTEGEVQAHLQGLESLRQAAGRLHVDLAASEWHTDCNGVAIKLGIRHVVRSHPLQRRAHTLAQQALDGQSQGWAVQGQLDPEAARIGLKIPCRPEWFSRLPTEVHSWQAARRDALLTKLDAALQGGRYGQAEEMLEKVLEADARGSEATIEAWQQEVGALQASRCPPAWLMSLPRGAREINQARRRELEERRDRALACNNIQGATGVARKILHFDHAGPAAALQRASSSAGQQLEASRALRSALEKARPAAARLLPNLPSPTEQQRRELIEDLSDLPEELLLEVLIAQQAPRCEKLEALKKEVG